MSIKPQSSSIRILSEQKSELRRQILALRNALPAEERQAAEAVITEKILRLTSFSHAQTILLTFPFDSEFATWAIVDAALQQGKVVVAPRINAARRLDLYAIKNRDTDLEPNVQKILEPKPSVCRLISPADLDWVMVPGVAFDRMGGRLGYGGGYYDRLFRDIPHLVPRVAPAFSCQMVEQVPMGMHDHAVDVIVTEVETIRIEGRLLGKRP